MRKSVENLIAAAKAAKEKRELSENETMENFKEEFIEQVIELLKTDPRTSKGFTTQLCLFLSYNENSIVICTRVPVQTKEHESIWLHVNTEKLGDTESIIPLPEVVKKKYVFSYKKDNFFNELTNIITSELPIKEHHTAFLHLIGYSVEDRLIGIFNINLATS